SIWTTNQKGEIFELDSNGKILQQQDLIAINKNININTVQKLYIVNDSTLLVGTMNNLFHFEIDQQKLTPILPGNIPHQVHAIINETDDTYWIGTELGLYIVELESKEIKKITREYAN